MKVYGLNNMEEVINSINPKNLINDLGSSVSISLYKVKYSYTTIRGNKKEGEKYLLKDGINPSLSLEERFYSWVSEYNDDNSHRKISNVKFLENTCVGFIKI